MRVGAHWGWPVVPDLIKDLTCKYAARLWRRRQTGENSEGRGGATDATGIGTASELFDAQDEALLLSSGYKRQYI